jgi:hypothetical protein
MPFDLKLGKLSGNPEKGSWTQIHDFIPSDNVKLEKRGRLVAIIAVDHLSEDIEYFAAAKEILVRLHEEYFAKDNTNAVEALKAAVSTVLDEFKAENVDLQIAAAAFIGSAVYVSAGGGTSALICRNGETFTLLGKAVEVASASGLVKEDDTLILASGKLLDRLTVGQIKAVVANNDPQGIVEMLTPVVYSGGDHGNLGAVFVKVVESGEINNVSYVKNIPTR